MELSKETLDGLVTAADGTAVSDTSYTLILQKVFEVAKCSLLASVCRCRSHLSIYALLKGFHGTVKYTIEIAIENWKCKAAFAGLLTLLLEAARHDSSASSISSVLEDCKFEQSRINLFLSKYEESKGAIQGRLGRIGRSFPHVIDVDWRQDFVIKTNHCEKVCEPSYIISLKTENSDSYSDVTFSCTVDQLQDLVLKLKDATKCIERNASH